MDPRLDRIRSEVEQLSAAEAAELFLSPYVATELLNEATREAGPAMWIVNRSDVYTQTLEKLEHHSIEDISSRAKTKLLQRKSVLRLFAPPFVEVDLDQVPSSQVEDLLGHPLAPFEAMLYFARSPSEDHRASAALSFTRRVLEHPSDLDQQPELRDQLVEAFSRLLLNDPSPFVRSYCSRIPLLTTQVLAKALENEDHEYVQARLLQNPASSVELLERAISITSSDAAQLSRVLAIDERLSSSLRARAKEKSSDMLSWLIHDWYAGRSA